MSDEPVNYNMNRAKISTIRRAELPPDNWTSGRSLQARSSRGALKPRGSGSAWTAGGGVRQHLRRAAMALGQVRGGLSARISDGRGRPNASGRLFSVLQ